MKKVILPVVRFYCVLLCVWLAGCDQKPVLTEVLSEKMEVVESPYPLGYPSTSPQKNRVIATLHRGERFYLRGEDFGKDYKYFEVELLNGQKGYVNLRGRRTARVPKARREVEAPKALITRNYK
jgi:hypothetical protein